MGKMWTEEDMKQALEEVENCSVSTRITRVGGNRPPTFDRC